MKQVYYYLGMALMAAIIMALPSCSTTHKQKSIGITHTNIQEKKDSVTNDSHVVDSGRLTTTTELHATTNEGSNTVETGVILKPDSNGINTMPIPATDFFSTDGLNKFLNDNKARIVGIKRKVTDRSKQTETTQQFKQDSSHATINDTHKASFNLDKSTVANTYSFNKSVRRTSWGWLWWLLLIPVGRVAYNIYKHRLLIS